MKATLKVHPSLVLEISIDKQKDLFKALASAQEVFGEKECGLCKSTNIVFAWRTATKMVGKKQEFYDYPEMHCKDCRARLAFGTIHDDTGTLFPTRKLLPNGQPAPKADKDKAVFGTHNGWSKYKGEVETD